MVAGSVLHAHHHPDTHDATAPIRATDLHGPTTPSFSLNRAFALPFLGRVLGSLCATYYTYTPNLGHSVSDVYKVDPRRHARVRVVYSVLSNFTYRFTDVAIHGGRACRPPGSPGEYANMGSCDAGIVA